MQLTTYKDEEDEENTALVGFELRLSALKQAPGQRLARKTVV
jgi:hypothetical protein